MVAATSEWTAPQVFTLCLAVFAVLVSAVSALVTYLNYRTSGEKLQVRPGCTKFTMDDHGVPTPVLLLLVQVNNIGRFQSVVPRFGIKLGWRRRWMSLEAGWPPTSEPSSERYGIVPPLDSRIFGFVMASNSNMEALRALSALNKLPRRIYVRANMASGRTVSSGWRHALRLKKMALTSQDLRGWRTDAPIEMNVDMVSDPDTSTKSWQVTVRLIDDSVSESLEKAVVTETAISDGEEGP